MTTDDLALDLRGLHKSFSTPAGTVRAVDGLDLAVRPGEVVAFLGPNGAGKTTTIDMVLGLAVPDSGTVRVLGHEPSEAIARGRVSAVMQTGGLLKDLTVRETLDLMASFYGTSAAVGLAIERAGLADAADRRVGSCSGGQQQRLRFALALLPDPDLLILDEPTTGMDVAGRRDFWNAIRADAAQGRTILFATHYLEEADAYADRIVLLSRGRVVADGTAAQVRAVASGRVVSAVLDAPMTVAELSALPGVDRVEHRGDRVQLHTRTSDALARVLLSTAGAHDLEITSLGLEEAFLTLTSDVPVLAAAESAAVTTGSLR
ncbi:MAG: ABC transporter ATP-binding protein [Actinobacteria bacterium]|nr:ABC transporter ATP-binding protein [Actinomycetota bacterium]MCG2801140.1 ABC transporter ATP-binding protein [Cellulomonas sp.]